MTNHGNNYLVNACPTCLGKRYYTNKVLQPDGVTWHVTEDCLAACEMCNGRGTMPKRDDEFSVAQANYDAALRAIGDIREALGLPNVASPKSPAAIAAETITYCTSVVGTLRRYADPDIYEIPSELEAVQGMHMSLDFGHEARAVLTPGSEHDYLDSEREQEREYVVQRLRQVADAIERGDGYTLQESSEGHAGNVQHTLHLTCISTNDGIADKNPNPQAKE